eukprot:8473152-Pyramimonas_sp.AAC.1
MTYFLYQDVSLQHLEPFSAGILELSLDETEMTVDLRRDGTAGTKAHQGAESIIEQHESWLT